MMNQLRAFAPWLDHWRLIPDGAAIVTSTSRLLPVRSAGAPAMLKIALLEEEQRGSSLMLWWNGRGAARVLASDGPAILLERATGPACLAGMSRSGGDDEATRILCGVLAELHRPGARPPETLVPLAAWFAPLLESASGPGAVIRAAAATAARLLATECHVTTLHGDLHHGNVLDFGPLGWRAIDPKALLGERGFDYANIFCNPDATTASAPGRLARRLDIIAATAELDRRRLLDWVIAWAGLSAVLRIGDGLMPDAALRIGARALAERAG